MEMQNFGEQLKEWRALRRVSQLALALEANVSARHISFLESGRASPSRQMVQQLARTLDVPLRGRNSLLQAAGFAAAYPETPLDDAALEPIRAAIGWMLDKHMPYPAMVFDRYWNLRGSNPVAATLFGLPDSKEPVNILEMIVGNPAATERFENWPEIVRHMAARLKLEVEASGGDPKLVAFARPASRRSGLQRSKRRTSRTRACLFARPHCRRSGAVAVLDDRPVRHIRGHHRKRPSSRTVLSGRSGQRADFESHRGRPAETRTIKKGPGKSRAF